MDIQLYKYNNGSVILSGVIDNYISCSFTRSYSGIGDFQIVIDNNAASAELLRSSDFIKLGQGVCGLINTSTIEVSQDGSTLTVNGLELKALAQLRIVLPPDGEAYLAYKNKTPEFIINNILRTQLTAPTDNKRKIAGTYADFDLISQEIDYNGRFGNAADEIITIATANNIGWYADIDNGGIVWHIIHGVDRRAAQNTNSRFILSYELDNIGESNLELSNYVANTALVAGQGEGTERATEMVNDQNSGLSRIETYIDARDIKDNSQLAQRGAEKLAAYGTEISYNCEAGNALLNEYRVGFELGDIGTLNDTNLDISTDFRLTEITEVYESNTMRLSITFGYDAQTLTESLKRIQTKTEGLIRLEGNDSGADGYLPLTGGALSGSLKLDNNYTASTAFNDQGLLFGSTTETPARISMNKDGGFGIYATGNIALRPGSQTKASSYGLALYSSGVTSVQTKLAVNQDNEYINFHSLGDTPLRVAVNGTIGAVGNIITNGTFKSYVDDTTAGLLYYYKNKIACQIRVTTEGTTTSSGVSTLYLGNALDGASETKVEGNLRGRLLIYGADGSYITLRSQNLGYQEDGKTLANSSVFIPPYVGTMYLAHTSSNAAVGGANSRPVYCAANGRITAITKVGIAYGGTGATTPEDALTNLGGVSIDASETIRGTKTFTSSPIMQGAYYPSFFLIPTETSHSTQSKGYIEASYDDVVNLWIDSDKDNAQHARRAIALNGYAKTTNPAEALTLRQCDTQGNWQNDLMVYHQGNIVYSSTAPTNPVNGMIWLEPID